MNSEENESLDWLESRVKTLYDRLIESGLEDSPEVYRVMDTLNSVHLLTRRLRANLNVEKSPFEMANAELTKIFADQTVPTLAVILKEEWFDRLPASKKIVA